MVTATVISYAVCAGVYALATALILPSKPLHKYKGLLLAACALTALWALAMAGAGLLASPWLPVQLAIIGLELAHSGAWIAIASFAIVANCDQKVPKGISRTLMAMLVGAAAYSGVASILIALGYDLSLPYQRGIYFSHVLLSIIALLLIENLFRNVTREVRWSTKYLCFGLGVTFSYDFFVYAEAMLLGHLDENLFAARGAISAISMPLIILFAARARSWLLDVHVSRKFVFHSLTLLSAGTYLIVMAVAGYSLRIFDGAWGIMSQSFFLMAALLLLAILLCSGEIQARLKNFVNQNFFAYKYDYRVEWLRFVNGVSDTTSAVPLPGRVVHALANIIESAAGCIWIRDNADRVFKTAAVWNLSGLPDSVSADDAWLQELARQPGVLYVARKVINNSTVFATPLPDWLTEHSQANIVLPLVHADILIGFIMLGHTRAPRQFDWEDTDLLATASRHAASYIAEENATLALEQVKRFEEFNHRFAFIVHDVKNIAGQMTLILKNAERHGSDPAFQADVMRTIGRCVERLRTMMEQLKNPEQTSLIAAQFDLVSLLDEIGREQYAQNKNVRTNLPDGPIHIVALDGQLRAIVNHLIQNATDAVGPGGNVDIELHVEGVMRDGSHASGAGEQWWVVITIADNGPGMDSHYIAKSLFEPFRSIKETGFGIGAFQARQMTRDMGGRLDVDSECGRGTRISVRLPYHPPVGSVIHGAPAEYQPSQLLKSA